jgi:hypothetical protein
VLSVPVARQFEQVVNARYLEIEGYGVAADEVSPGVLGAFLERQPELSRNLARYRQDGNRRLLDELGARLEEAVRSGGPPFEEPDGDD